MEENLEFEDHEADENRANQIRRKGFLKLALGVVTATFSILSYPAIAPVSGIMLAYGGLTAFIGAGLQATGIPGIKQIGGGLRMIGGAIATAGLVGLASPGVGVALGLEGAYNIATKKDTPAELPLAGYMPNFIRKRLPTPSVFYNIAKLYGKIAKSDKKDPKTNLSDRDRFNNDLGKQFKRGSAANKKAIARPGRVVKKIPKGATAQQGKVVAVLTPGSTPGQKGRRESTSYRAGSL